MLSLLRHLPKALYNVTILRGRRRITRLLFVVILSGFAFTLVRHGLCMMRGESCYGNTDNSYLKAEGAFMNGKDYHGTLNSGPHRRISGRIVDVSKPPPVSQVSLRDSKLQDSDKDNVELQDKYDQDNELAFVGDHQDSKVDTGMEEEGYQREGGLQDNQLQDDAGIAQQALESKFDGAGEVKAAMGPPSDIQSHESEKETKQAVPRKQPPGVVTITKDEMKKQAEAAAAGKKELQKKSQPPGIVTMTRDEVRRQAEAAAASKVESQKKPQQAGVITISKSELKKQQERPPSPKPVANQRPIQQVRGAQPNQGALVVQKQPPQPPARRPAPSRQENMPTPSAQQRRMSADDVAKAIRSGEMCKSVCPPFVWSEWSPCSKACGRGRKYRKAIYEFVCQSSEACPLNRLEESVCETPCRFDPKKYGGPDGLEMYPINPLNPPIYPEERNYMCGHWLVEYEKVHNEILTGKRPPAYLVYSTGKGDYPTAGGISGRIRGITTVFFMAVLLERAFLIEWVDPLGLEDYLEPKSFNWADLTPIQKLRRGPIRDIGSWRSFKESGKSSQWYMNTNFSTYLKFPVEVVQGHRYDFTYAVFRNPELMPKAYELGVDRVKCRICCAFDMLFKMTSKFEKEMGDLLKTLGHPSSPLFTVQLRSKNDDVQTAIKMAEQFVSCATKASKELKLRKPVLVPIFNNRLVMHMVVKKFSDKMKNPIHIDTATRTVHNHLGSLPPDTEVEVAKGVQERSFKDFFLILNSTVLIRTKGYVGSFGNVADAIRRHYGEQGTFWTYTVGSTCTVFPDGYKIE